MAWAFFMPNSSSSLEINSTSNQHEHLRCLFYGPIALGVGFRKGIITYKTTNGIFVLQKHLELLHWQLWSEWVDREKDGLNAKKDLPKQGLCSTSSNIKRTTLTKNDLKKT
jgi:hypothetical protein